MKKLKLCKVKEDLDYMVPVPNRMKDLGESKVRIVFRAGEYFYQPRTFTFNRSVIYSVDELEAIIVELKRLNNGGK